MKCKLCNAELVEYQRSKRADGLEIRYRCTCGQYEHVEFITDKHKKNDDKIKEQGE